MWERRTGGKGKEEKRRKQESRESREKKLYMADATLRGTA
jgi:hypothetical protein